MRQSICAIAFGVTALSAYAADETTTQAPSAAANPTTTWEATKHLTIVTFSGDRYERCKVNRTDPDGLYITHSRGTAKINFRDLPYDLARKYGYNLAKANRYSNEQTAAERAAAYRHAPQQAVDQKPKEVQAQRKQSSEQQVAAQSTATHRPAEQKTTEQKRKQGEEQHETLAQRRYYSVPEFPKSNPLPHSLGKTDRRSLQEFSDWVDAETESLDREIERQDRELEQLHREGVINWTP